METSTKSYQELKYKTTVSLSELEQQIEQVRNFAKMVKMNIKDGKLSWNTLGDVNRVKVGLQEFTFLSNFKNTLDMKR